MNTQCSHCQAVNEPGVPFCRQCGKTLASTSDQGRTVAMQSPSSSLSQVDAKTIVQRTQQAFGTDPIQLNTAIMAQSFNAQREETAVVMDISGSMNSPYDGRYTKLEAAIRAKINMILHKEQIDPEDEIGIVTFSHKACTLLPLHPISSHKQQIISTLQALTVSGGTDINEGLKAARDLFDWSRNGVVRRIVLLTDGCGGHPIRTAQDLKSRGVVIDVIGVGETPTNVDERLLKKVASVVDGELRYRFIKDQQTLVAHITQLGGTTAVCP